MRSQPSSAREARVAGKVRDDDLAGRAQARHLLVERLVARRTARGSRRRGPWADDQRRDAAKVHGEAGGRPRAPEGPAHLVVAPAPRDRVGEPGVNAANTTPLW